MGLENIFSQLNAGSKSLIHLSVTPGVGLELIELDVSTKTITNYACRPLEYNDALRELTSIETFKETVRELFAELNISLKSNVVLNLPMVLFGSIELPLILGDEAIDGAVISEVEQSYVFKRHAPLVSWFDSNSSKSNEVRKLFYSALQKDIIDNIKAVLSELGITLVGVDVSLASLLRALVFAGLLEEQTKEGVSWNLMLINQSGYSLCSMVGKNIVDYYEEPLAIRSFEDDEIYNAINASAQITLMSYPANYLYIVSETDLVSAELLAKRIQVDCNVDFCENNNYKKQDYIPVRLEVIEENAKKISLEAIGIAVGNVVSIPLKFNFLGKSSGELLEDPNEPVHVALGASEFDISPNAARNLALIFSLILLLPFLLLMVICPMVTKNKQAALDEITDKVKKVEAEVKSLQKQQNKTSTFDVNAEMKRVLKDNRAKLMAYTALGESVPPQLWITYFIAKDDGKFNIKGASSNVEDVYVFYRNMKDSLINTQLRLHKLEMRSSLEDAVSDGSNDYEFEITNMNNAELNPQAVKIPDESQGQDATKTDKKPVNLLNKPLLNLGKEVQ